MRDELKVGVFLCECGGNISDIIDLDKVREELDVEFIGQFDQSIFDGYGKHQGTVFMGS